MTYNWVTLIKHDQTSPASNFRKPPPSVEMPSRPWPAILKHLDPSGYPLKPPRAVRSFGSPANGTALRVASSTCSNCWASFNCWMIMLQSMKILPDMVPAAKQNCNIILIIMSWFSACWGLHSRSWSYNLRLSHPLPLIIHNKPPQAPLLASQWLASPPPLLASPPSLWGPEPR